MLIADIGKACLTFHNEHVRNVLAGRVQVDEAWCYCEGKDRTVGERKRMTGVGSVWVFAAMDAKTKIMISWHLGNRDVYSAQVLMLDLAERITDRIQLTTHALSPNTQRRPRRNTSKPATRKSGQSISGTTCPWAIGDPS